MSGQIFRFGVVGALCAVIYSGVYLAYVLVVLPISLNVAAVLPAFLLSVYVGYHLQSRFTFGTHDLATQGARTRMKFVITQCVGLLMNCAITWIITGPLQGPDWVPLLPSICITPTATFALQRWWVFRGARPLEGVLTLAANERPPAGTSIAL